jgi:hypothetical protein
VGVAEPKICVVDLNEGLGPRHAFQCKTYRVVIKK